MYIFWCKNDYSAIFVSKVMKCWTSPCMITFKRCFTEIWNLKDYNVCALLWANQEANVLTPLLFHIFSLIKRLSWLCLVWLIFWKDISKMKFWLLAPIFAYDTKINCKDPCLYMLGYLFYSIFPLKKMFVMIVFSMVNILEEYIKNEIFWLLAHCFCLWHKNQLQRPLFMREHNPPRCYVKVI